MLTWLWGARSGQVKARQLLAYMPLCGSAAVSVCPATPLAPAKAEAPSNEARLPWAESG